MFSARLDWSAPQNRIARLLERLRAEGRPLLDLTESNPTQAGFQYPAGRIAAALSHRAALVYEPAAAGLEQARQAVAGYYGGRGIPVEPEQIVLTASTSEAYAYLFKLLADPGDQILVPRPSYPLFEYLARLESVEARQYPLLYDHGWILDFQGLAEAAGPRVRAVVVVNPNNPTGSFLKKCELELLTRFCRDRDIAVISDEVFSDFAFRPDPQRVETLCGGAGVTAFCLSGLSKTCGLPQMKLAWIVVSGPPEPRARAMKRLELVADTYLSAAAPVQHALPELLAAGATFREQARRRTAANLEFLRQVLDGRSGCRVLDVEGGWYATIQAPRILSEDEWTLALLERDGVLVQPGYFFDFESEAFLVVSLLTPEDRFQEGVVRLARRAESAAS